MRFWNGGQVCLVESMPEIIHFCEGHRVAHVCRLDLGHAIVAKSLGGTPQGSKGDTSKCYAGSVPSTK
jgi:hypothetical protein